MPTFPNSEDDHKVGPVVDGLAHQNQAKVQGLARPVGGPPLHGRLDDKGQRHGHVFAQHLGIRRRCGLEDIGVGALLSQETTAIAFDRWLEAGGAVEILAKAAAQGAPFVGWQAQWLPGFQAEGLLIVTSIRS
jgi:hypothetical protein